MKTEETITKEFREQMYKKIEERHNRYQPFAWRDMDLKRLIKLLEGELAELKEGYAQDDAVMMSKEAIDVANYACFIWEMIRTTK